MASTSADRFGSAPYILDLVCLPHRLVIEADGPFHDASRDAVRDAWLASQGFRVMRFSNDDIQERDWLVIQRIRIAVTAPSIATDR